MDAYNEISFAFEYKNHDSQIRQTFALFFLALMLWLGVIVLGCVLWSYGFDLWLFIYCGVFLLAALGGTIAYRYIFMFLVDQQMYCENTRITIDKDKQTITFYDIKKDEANVVPIDKIRSVTYYSSSMLMNGVANYQLRSILYEHMIVDTEDGEIYLAFFYLFFKYLYDRKTELSFPVEVKTFWRKHKPPLK